MTLGKGQSKLSIGLSMLMIAVAACAPHHGVGRDDAQVPFAPTILNVSTEDGIVAIRYEPPIDDGGAKIVTHIATCTADNEVRTTAAGSGVASFPTLMGGKTYTCTVAAMNKAGTGPASNPVQVTTGAAAYHIARTAETH